MSGIKTVYCADDKCTTLIPDLIELYDLYLKYIYRLLNIYRNVRELVCVWMEQNNYTVYSFSFCF
jgi:hypothetical protein